MFENNQQLINPADFDNAMYMQLPVSVWCEGQIINYGAPISRHDEITVYIDEWYYVKDTHQFRIY